jgi:hypothetical protein
MNTDTEDLLARIPHVWTLKKPYSMKEIQRVLTEISQTTPGTS